MIIKKFKCLLFFVLSSQMILAQNKDDIIKLSITVDELIEDTVLLPTLEELIVFSESEKFQLNPKIKTLKRLRSLSILVEGKDFELPSWIGELNQLEELYIKWTLKTVPKEVYQLKNLTALSLIGDYTSIPEGISELQNLMYLNIISTELMTLPDDIVELNHLGFLGINKTKIESLPLNFSLLTELEYLDLGNNLLKSIPDLSVCTSLMEVNIHENRVIPFVYHEFTRNNPKIIVKYDYKFQKFKVDRSYQQVNVEEENRFISVLRACKKRKKALVLDLSNHENIKKELRDLSNNIDKLDGIKVLKLSGNKLTELPKEIFQLTGLKELYIDDNLLMSIPEEVIYLDQLSVLSLSKNPMPMLDRELLKMHHLNKFIIDKDLLNQFVLDAINKNMPNVKVIDL